MNNDLILLVMILGFIQLILLVVSFVDIFKNKNLNNKMLWYLISLISFIGPLLYFTIGKKNVRNC